MNKFVCGECGQWTTRCQCDPVGSGEEYCTGNCESEIFRTGLQRIYDLPVLLKKPNDILAQNNEMRRIAEKALNLNSERGI